MNSYYEKFAATGVVKCIDDEIPFEIPKGWEWVRLKHICTMQAGKNIKAEKIHSAQTNVYPYRCVGGNGLRGYTNTYNMEGHFSIVGRQGALCGCLNIEKGKFYATEHAVVVDTYKIISSTFMYHFLTALNLNQYATATAQPGLAVSNIIEVLCPIPPMPEQQRIVEKIELLQPLVHLFDRKQGELSNLNFSIQGLLRKSILQEAIQGRLVPQIAEEGTAQELLEQIKQEKQKLVKKGKLKKSAQTDSVIFRGEDNKYYEQVGKTIICIEEQIPFEIPENWIWIRLNSIANLYTGNSISESEKKSRYSNVTGYEYIGTKDVGFDHTVNYANGIAIPNKYINKFKIAPSQSILLCIEGGSAGKKIARIDRNVCFGNKLCCFMPYSIFLSKYIYYYMQAPSFFEIFRGNIAGIIGGVSVNTLKTLLIPLPPLPEQQRIVERIELLFEQQK